MGAAEGGLDGADEGRVGVRAPGCRATGGEDRAVGEDGAFEGEGVGWGEADIYPECGFRLKMGLGDSAGGGRVEVDPPAN